VVNLSRRVVQPLNLSDLAEHALSLLLGVVDFERQHPRFVLGIKLVFGRRNQERDRPIFLNGDGNEFVADFLHSRINKAALTY
jgi:hypothetical protein